MILPSPSEGPKHTTVQTIQSPLWPRPASLGQQNAAGFSIINLETRGGFYHHLLCGSRFRCCLRASLREHSGIGPRGHALPPVPLLKGRTGRRDPLQRGEVPREPPLYLCPPACTFRPWHFSGDAGVAQWRPGGSRRLWHGRRVIGARQGQHGGRGGDVPRGAGPRHTTGPRGPSKGARGHGSPLPCCAPGPCRTLPAAPPAH